MTTKQIVEAVLAYAGTDKKKLADILYPDTVHPAQLLQKRLTTGKFDVNDWARIASAVSAKCSICFTFADGKSITLDLMP